MFLDCIRTDAQPFGGYPVGVLLEIAEAYNRPRGFAESFDNCFGLTKQAFVFPIPGLQVEYRCFADGFRMIGYYLPVLEPVKSQMTDRRKKP